MKLALAILLLNLGLSLPACADDAPPGYDVALAQRLGADQRRMPQYVLGGAQTGATPVAQGQKRRAAFKGHFANMERLSKQGKLALAGPFEENADGWRGLFVFAVSSVEEAKALTATDPVIVNGEMVAEYHPWYGSAAVMLVPETHARLEKPAAP